MKITASMVKELRDETSAGMMDCKKALVEADGDMKKAEKILREKGQATAEKKAGRVTSEGVVTSYIHGNGRIGVLLELNCESDFTAKNEVFQELAKDIAMQIAASSPLYVNEDEIPQDIVESEKEILKKQALKEGKPEKIVDKMVEGRIKKFYKDVCLLDQDFIKNPDITIKELIEEKITQIRENISVRRFTRYEMGEGLEKKQEDFAQEVNKQLGK